MNAPATAATVARPALEHLALASIKPSETHIQALRRKRFDPKALQELADSIKAVGVLQPVVVVARAAGQHELVAGERRWLAAKLAGVATVPATVRELTPEQILEVQLIENLQREGLHELEEAEGYEELMRLKKINADTVADMVGKSRSYVYARTKLLALCPEARKAFYAGELDASRALLVARIGHHDTQRKALNDLTEGYYNSFGAREPMSYREAQRHILQNYMLKLKAAPFDTADATLVPKAGACGPCPKRTGNQRDLFGDVKDADVCTDPKCFADKRAAGEAKVIAEYKAKGVELITGDKAKSILPYSDSDASAGYHTLTATCWQDPKHRTYAELAMPFDIKVVQSPHTGKLVKVVHNSAVAAARPGKGGQKVSAKAKPDRDIPDLVERVTDRAIAQAHKLKGPLTTKHLQLVARELLITVDQVLGRDARDGIYKLYGWTAKHIDYARLLREVPGAVQKLSPAELATLILVLLAAVSLEDYRDNHPTHKVLGIDPKKIEQAIRAEVKAQAEAAKKAPAAKPATKAKAAPAKKKPAGKAKGKKK